MANEEMRVPVARGHYGKAVQLHGVDSPEARAAHAELEAAKLREHIRRTVPKLNSAQRDRIRLLVTTAGASDDDAA